jgi:hypothetical protein
MLNLLNYNLLIYVILICIAFLLSYFIYNLIKNNYFSKNIAITSNNTSNKKADATSDNKFLAFRNIIKFSSIPVSNGTVSTSTIHQLKYQEIITNYPRELAEFRVSNAEV